MVSNVDWAVLSHRMPLIRRLIAEGASVTVACADTGQLGRIAAEGADAFAIPMSRAGKRPIQEVRTILAMFRVLRHVSPDILQTSSLKANLYGTLVARIASRRTVVVNLLSGFGYALEDGARKSMKLSARCALRLLMGRENVHVVVQNFDALARMNQLVPSKKHYLIEGSGVDCVRFSPLPPRDGACAHQFPVRVLCAARLLTEKGIFEYIAAAKVASLQSPHTEFLLAGPFDNDNPCAISKGDLNRALADSPVRYLGEVSDMPELLKATSIFVQPSYHEGLPKALLEAAAAGLPMIASDIPGCRPVVIPGETGLLVPPKSTEELAHAIGVLLADRDLRKKYGHAARALAVARFDNAIIADAFSRLYGQLLTEK